MIDDGKIRNFRAHAESRGHGSVAELQKYIQDIEQDEQAVSGLALVAAAQAKKRTGSD